MTNDAEREAVLRQNEMLRDARYASVRERLHRCVVCLRRRCKDREKCADELGEWTKPRWDALADSR